MLLQMTLFCSFLWLSSIHCTCVLYLLYPSVCRWTCRLSPYPKIFTIVNSVTANTGLYASFQLEFCLDICPVVGLLDPVIIPFLVF